MIAKTTVMRGSYAKLIAILLSSNLLRQKVSPGRWSPGLVMAQLGPGISFLGERERQGYALAVVSAFAWGTEGRRFESCHLDRESSRAYPWRMGRTTKLVNSQGVNE